MTEEDVPTRDLVLAQVVEYGPITAGTIADALSLTPAAVRRHTSLLLEEGLITDHAPVGGRAPKRGRPARYFVATDVAREEFTDSSAKLATQALRHIEMVAGREALVEFLTKNIAELEKRFLELLEEHEAARGEADLRARVENLAAALNEDHFAATVRELGDGFALQLCQGHCPVLGVADHVPQLCEIETKAFSKMLDTHVQRLSTLAGGGHVCTTHIPLVSPAEIRRVAH